MASGLGATGCTGLVCLAASFFRLILLFSNISCMDVCFWSTFSTWSWPTGEDRVSNFFEEGRSVDAFRAYIGSMVHGRTPHPSVELDLSGSVTIES